MIKKDYEYYVAHREEYLREHAGEFAVVEKETLLGFFPDEMSALVFMKDHEVGNFLVKKVIPANEDFVEYHTRAISFA
jgi:hypothetical protein